MKIPGNPMDSDNAAASATKGQPERVKRRLTLGSMSEDEYHVWDVVTKILTLVGVLAGGWWAVHSYNMTSEKEFRHPFWDKELTLYFDATDAASKYVALYDDTKEREANRQKFWTLYYGQLAVVENDEKVCEAMVDFGKCLAEPGLVHAEEICNMDDLRLRALRLSNAARMSIGVDWDTKLDSLRAPPDKSTCRLRMFP